MALSRDACESTRRSKLAHTMRCQVGLNNKSSLLNYLLVPADRKAQPWPLLYMRFHALAATTSASFTA